MQIYFQSEIGSLQFYIFLKFCYIILRSLPMNLDLLKIDFYHYKDTLVLLSTL